MSTVAAPTAAAVASPSLLDALPEEIKTLIAQQCQLQEVEWRHRASAEVHVPPHSGLTAWASFRRTKPQSSLRSLFAVSREWSRLVAPMIYEASRTHLDAQNTEALADPVFRFDILRRRGALVKTVSALPGDDIADWEDLVHCLPGLPNVDELHMTCWELQFLQRPELDGQVDPVRFKAKHDEVHLAVVDLLRNVKSLVLHGATACTIFAQLGLACPPPAVFAVERLVIRADTVYNFDDWPDVVQSMPRLRSLDVHVALSETELHLPPVAFGNLRHLTVRGEHDGYTRCFLRLAQLHSATLETLSLSTSAPTADEANRDFPAFPPFAGTFPRLRKLTIDPWAKASRGSWRSLLDSITPERFPKLRVLAVRPEQAFATESDLGPAFEQLVARPGFLLCEPASCMYQVYELFAYQRGPVAVETKRRRNPDVSQTVLDEILAARAAHDEAQLAPDGALRAQLGDVVRFLSTSFFAASQLNDITALGRLAQAVKGLVMEQMFMET